MKMITLLLFGALAITSGPSFASESTMISDLLSVTSAIITADKPMSARLEELKAYHKELSSALLTDLYDDSEAKNGVRGFIEYETWDLVNRAVLAQVTTQAIGQTFRDEILNEAADLLSDQATNEIRGYIWDQIFDQIWDKNPSFKVDTQTRIRLEILRQVTNEVNRSIEPLLREARFPLVYNREAIRAGVAPVIEYTFTVYQLASLIMRKSPEFRSIEQDLTRNNASTNISILAIPPEYQENNHLIQTQLEIFERFVPKPEA